MDIATLKKTPWQVSPPFESNWNTIHNANVRQSIITIVVVLGFMVSVSLCVSRHLLSQSRSHMDTLQTSSRSHERDSVFTSRCVLEIPPRLVKGSSMGQVEHIDNPKGYGDGKDPRESDPGLRPVCIDTEFAISELLTLIR